MKICKKAVSILLAVTLCFGGSAAALAEENFKPDVDSNADDIEQNSKLKPKTDGTKNNETGQNDTDNDDANEDNDTQNFETMYYALLNKYTNQSKQLDDLQKEFNKLQEQYYDLQDMYDELEQEVNSDEDESEAEPEAENDEDEEVTPKQQEALEKAQLYNKYYIFSYSGLIDQLKTEGYTSEESTYAADNCGWDWFEQAVRRAENLLVFADRSRDELIEALEVDGFTAEEADYAADVPGM